MDLDRHNDFHKIDKNGIYSLIEELPSQIELAWDQLKDVILPANYINIKNIHLIYPEEEYIQNELILPIVNSYNIPLYLNNISQNINKECLIIASSFYGNDDKIIQIVNYAAKLEAKLFILTTGGELASLSKKYRCPIYLYRPSAINEYSIAFPTITLFNILNKLKLIEYKDDIEELLLLCKGLMQKIKPDIITEKNIAKQLAQLLNNKIPIILGSKISMPVINRFASMLSINAKIFSFNYNINHFSANQIYKDILPDRLFNNAVFLIFHSKYDSPQDHIKLLSACQILEKRRIRYETISIQPSGRLLSELFQKILLTDHISYYLAILNNNDPLDYVLKEQFDSMVESNIGHKIRTN